MSWHSAVIEVSPMKRDNEKGKTFVLVPSFKVIEKECVPMCVFIGSVLNQPFSH